MSNRKIFESVIGKEFNDITIISEPISKDIGGKKRRVVKCECVCGNQFESIMYSVMSGHTKSCGCAQLVFKDVLKAKKMRSSHNAMLRRCKDTDGKHYKYYLAKGIKVCDRWLDFNNFYEDMQESWELGLELDRIENDKGYYKVNCRWATKAQQQRNKTNIVMSEEKVIAIRNSNLPQKELSDIYQVNQSTISKIKNNKRWNLN